MASRWLRLGGMLGSLAMLLALASPAWAAPGDLDTSFSSDGKVTTNVTSGPDFATGLALQGDGKIVASGGASDRFALTRYNSDGSLDTSFGGDGKVTTNFTSGFDSARSVAVLDDGRLVAGGVAGERFAVARFDQNGALDSTFRGDGKVRTDVRPGNDDGWDIVVQPDGKIILAGIAGGENSVFALVRYNTDGALDDTFGGDGKVTTNFASGSDACIGVALQSDGKIVAGGSAGSRFAVARYNSDGSLDTTFGGDGKVTTNFTSRPDGGNRVVLQGDGKIVLAGFAGGAFGQNTSFAVARYDTDGGLDGTFSGDGKVTTNFTSGFDSARAPVILGDGSIVAVGVAHAAGGAFALARYTAAGSLDTTFGGDGRVTTNFSSGFDGAVDAALQVDGKIAAAGSASGPSRFALARYLTA